MKLLFGSFLTLLVAAAFGLGATWLALTRGTAFGAVHIGAWTAWPRTGELPVGLGDGVAFVARHDDTGRMFDGRCEVVLRGTTPAARFWTLTLYDPEGRLVANSANRYGFTSQEIVRAADGGFEIVAAPRARPGNWLPTGGAERYALVLRLYDTPVGVATGASHEVPMPSIAGRPCT